MLIDVRGQVGRGAVAALVGEDGLPAARRRTASRGSSTAPSASGRSAPTGPRRTGRAPGSVAAKRSAAGRLSRALRPTNAISLPRVVETCWKSGNSARQGPHHEAHLLITTGWPRSSRMRASNAAVPPSSSWLDWSCRAASGAGAPARSFWAAARSKRPPDRPGGVGPAGLRQSDDNDGHDGDGGEQHQGPLHRQSGSHTGDGLRSGCFNGRTRGRQIPRGLQPQRLPARCRARERSIRSFVANRGGRHFPRTSRLSLAESTSVADQVTHAPTSADLERAAKFTREPFLFEGEDAATALAPGSPRRVALDAVAGRARRRAQGALGRVAPQRSRCCSASSGCSARRSRSWSTARCSPRTRSTRSRAR